MFKLGVVPMPGNVLLTSKDIEYRVNRAEACMVITDMDHVGHVELLRDKSPSSKHLMLVDGKQEGWLNYDEEMSKVSRELKQSDIGNTRSTDPMLIQLDLSKYNLKLRHSMSAGEPLNPEVIRVWKKAFGLEIYDFYGQTETVCVLSNYPFMPIKYGSIGKPTPGHDVRIVDDDGIELKSNEEGNIALYLGNGRPPGLFKEYWKDEEIMEKAFRGDYYYTGDRGYKDEDGYFWFVGRDDDVIKSSGCRIGPFEVESALMEHDAVAECAVVGVTDPNGVRGIIVKAFVLLAKGYKPSETLTKELQKHVKKVTAPYKYPRIIEYVKELPKTISGKILRRELRKK